MGFLNNLLRREVRKVINSAVDTAVDSVVGSMFGREEQTSGNEAGASDTDHIATENRSAARQEDTAAENRRATKQANNSGERLLRQRIEEIAAREQPQYELRQRIPSSQVNAPKGAEPYFDYGFYRDGQLVAVIIILDDNNAYRRISVRQAQWACRNQQVAYMNFMSYMMNRPEYISQRFKENLK